MMRGNKVSGDPPRQPLTLPSLGSIALSGELKGQESKTKNQKPNFKGQYSQLVSGRFLKTCQPRSGYALVMCGKALPFRRTLAFPSGYAADRSGSAAVNSDRRIRKSKAFPHSTAAELLSDYPVMVALMVSPNAETAPSRIRQRSI